MISRLRTDLTSNTVVHFVEALNCTSLLGIKNTVLFQPEGFQPLICVIQEKYLNLGAWAEEIDSVGSLLVRLEIMALLIWGGGGSMREPEECLLSWMPTEGHVFSIMAIIAIYTRINDALSTGTIHFYKKA